MNSAFQQPQSVRETKKQKERKQKSTSAKLISASYSPLLLNALEDLTALKSFTWEQSYTHAHTHTQKKNFLQSLLAEGLQVTRLTRSPHRQGKQNR